MGCYERCSKTNGIGLELAASVKHISSMSRVEQIESDLGKLSPAELRQVRDWLDDFVEDRMEFTAEFESDIRDSEREMGSGVQPRVRQP